MNNDLPNPVSTPPEQMPVSPAPGTSPPPAVPAQKSRTNLAIIIGALVLVLCLCLGLCLAVFGTGTFKFITERPKIESVVAEFMTAMANKDAGRAYALLSTRSKRHTSLADLENMLKGNNYVVFDSYRSVTVTNLNLSAAFNPDPDAPQGTVANVEGTVAYDGGFTGTFRAVLEQEAGQWRLFGINVVVPPDKFGSP